MEHHKQQGLRHRYHCACADELRSVSTTVAHVFCALGACLLCDVEVFYRFEISHPVSNSLIYFAVEHYNIPECVIFYLSVTSTYSVRILHMMRGHNARPGIRKTKTARTDKRFCYEVDAVALFVAEIT